MGKWEMVRLGDVCEVINGYAFQSSNYVDVGARVIRITNVQKGQIVDDDSKFYPESDLLKRYLLQKHDLLLSLTGNVGRVGLLPNALLPAYLNQRVACIRENNAQILNKRFLFYCLNNDVFEKVCIDSSKGLAQKNMSTEWLKDYTIPLPSLEEQQKIADVLDCASTLIEKRKAQIAMLDLLVKSQFIEMFGDLVTNPKGWESRRLKEIVKIRSSKRVYQRELTADGIPFLRVSDLVNRVIHGTNICDLYISEELFDDFMANGFVPKEDDILVTSRGTLGLCYIVRNTDKFYFQDGMISWLEKQEDDINSVYLAYLFQSDFIKQQIDQVSSGSTVNYISLANLGEFKILFPPIGLQSHFAAFVAEVKESKVKMQQALAQQELLYKSLIQKCFNEEMI